MGSDHLAEVGLRLLQFHLFRFPRINVFGQSILQFGPRCVVVDGFLERLRLGHGLKAQPLMAP